ncbi:hypothetical protein WA026_023067 [Henosepilachna vigintioctopunctata]|uniref:Phorbol-ester/DAG-type domain-containing protein n=1 Tax=Henosepilachna vigintioctopunctata TaxID=420089 RepID=A0AAW1UVL4_9CUCU
MAAGTTRKFELPIKRCKKCHIIPNSGLQCINCGTLMHPGCIKYYSDIIKVDEHHIKCCELMRNNNLQDDDSDLDTSKDTIVDVNDLVKSNENIIFELTRENEKLLNENALLKKLISEMDDKNNLLLFKISVLEKDAKTGVRRAALTLNNENNHIEDMADAPVLPTKDKKTSSDKMQRSTNSWRGQQPSGTHRRINNNKTANHTWNEGNNVTPNDSVREIWKERQEGARNKIIKGTRATKYENSFAGVEQRAWIHVGKVKLKTAKEEIENHLQQIFPGRSFVVEALPARNEANSMSFRVGGDMDLIDELYNSANWPCGVTIRRFTFFRKVSSDTNQGR